MKTVALELQPCCGKRSGIGVYTYELAKRLRDDEQLHFAGNLFNFCGRNHNSDALQGITIPIHENQLLPYGIYRRIWRWLPFPYERFFDSSADLSIFFNYIVPPHVGGKVITAIYDLTYLRFAETMETRNRMRLTEGLGRSVSRSDRILTISDFSKAEIHTLLQVPEEKIAVVPCAPSFSEDMETFEALQRRFGIQRPYLLYVGTIEPRKNLPRLLQAFTIAKQKGNLSHSLVLAGARGWNCGDFDRALAACSERDNIYLTDYISNAEKNCLYQNADAFVFPSLYEGFGIPPLEAMHFDCPVICSSAASLPEVVGDAAELVDPMCTESIADGILHVLSDQSHKNTLISKGRAQAQKYTWENSAQLLRTACREVLSET